jgi:hypothetical protein
MNRRVGVYEFNYMRSLIQKSGLLITAFIQPTHTDIITLGPHETIITGPRLKYAETQFKHLKLNSFIDEDFLSNPNYLPMIKQAQSFRDNIYFYTDEILNTKSNYANLPLDNEIVKNLGAYIDENDQIKLGPGYDELDYIFSRLIPGFKVSNTYDDPNNLVYKIFSIEILKDKTNIIQNMKYRNTQTQKELLQLILIQLQAFSQIPIEEIPLKYRRMEYKLIENLFDKEGNNVFFDEQGKPLTFTFNKEDPQDNINYEFNMEDLILAQRIKDTLISLIGGFIFKEMLRGAIFPKDGIIRFVRVPWIIDRKISRKIGLSIPSEFVVRETQSISENKQWDYTIARFFEPYSITLTPYSKLYPSELSQLKVNGIPLKLIAPNYLKPINPTLYKGFYYRLLNFYVNDFNTRFLHQDFQNWDFQGRYEAFNILMDIYEAQNPSQDKFKLAEKALRFSLFSLGEEVSLRRDESFRVRAKLYDFLVSRGETSEVLFFKHKEIPDKVFSLTLNKDVYNKFFLDCDLVKIIYSLERLTLFHERFEGSELGDRPTAEIYTVNALSYMKNGILEMFDFFWSLTYDQQGNRRNVILYFFQRFDTGFGYNPASKYLYMPENIDDLNEWDIEDQTSVPQRALILDPDKPQDFNPAELLGAMLIDFELVIARTEGMEEGDLLFAGDISKPYMDFEVLGAKRYISPPEDGMSVSDEWSFLSNYFKWYRILDVNTLMTLPRFNNPVDFYQLINDPRNEKLMAIREYVYLL